LEEPLKGELFEVERSRPATDFDVVSNHFDFQRPNPPSGSFQDPVPDGLFEFRRTRPALFFCGHGYIPRTFAAGRCWLCPGRLPPITQKLFRSPTRPVSAIPRNKPVPTTPGIARMFNSRLCASSIGSIWQSRMWLPLSVTNKLPP